MSNICKTNIPVNIFCLAIKCTCRFLTNFTNFEYLIICPLKLGWPLAGVQCYKVIYCQPVSFSSPGAQPLSISENLLGWKLAESCWLVCLGCPKRYWYMFSFSLVSCHSIAGVHKCMYVCLFVCLLVYLFCGCY